MRSQEDIQLVVCATNARTARRHVFTNRDISVDALLASACLPTFFRAVEIDGEPFWDGGWTGNPALGPLALKVPECDLIVVRIDPVNRPETPRSMRDIYERTTEISFNSALWLELAAGAGVLRFGERGLLHEQPLGRTRFHIIEASPIMEKFPMSSKRNTYLPMLEYLHDLGCEADFADIWRPTGSSYRVAATYQTTAAQKEYLATLPIAPSRGSCVGRTLLEAKIVHIPDIREDAEYTLDLTKLGERRTMLGVPLLRDGKPIGVLALTRTTVRPFTSRQIELVTTFATQAVIAIENARLLNELRVTRKFGARDNA